MNPDKASVILEKAMLRLANAANSQKNATNQKLAGRAIAINMQNNLIDLFWNSTLDLPEISTKKARIYIH